MLACLEEHERAAAAAEAAGGARAAGAAALWGALRVMARHGGVLAAPPGARAAKDSERPGAAPLGPQQFFTIFVKALHKRKVC